ncbi:hypothetical protein ND747_15910, partial [Frankia sp. R82]|nr:hypothetical protein [Frankia sp. R82]
TTRIGSAPPAELTAAAAALAPLTAVRASDPLGLPAQAAAQARAALDRAAVTVNQLVSAYDALDEGLRNADALLDLILAIAAEGEGAARQTAVRIRVAAEELSCLPTGWLDDPDRGLRPWLHRLHGLATAPRRLAAVHGLAAWTTTAEQTLAQARHIAEGNAAPLRRRDELRGLLRALRQKAAATGLAEDPELEQLYAGAHDLLYTAPTDLTVARHKVTAYAGALNRDPHHAGHQDQERGHT